MSFYRECRVTYHNWFEGRQPLPVRVAIYDKEGELKEDVAVENKTAIIIKANGTSILAKMERRMGLIGNGLR